MNNEADWEFTKEPFVFFIQDNKFNRAVLKTLGWDVEGWDKYLNDDNWLKMVRTHFATMLWIEAKYDHPFRFLKTDIKLFDRYTSEEESAKQYRSQVKDWGKVAFTDCFWHKTYGWGFLTMFQGDPSYVLGQPVANDNLKGYSDVRWLNFAECELKFTNPPDHSIHELPEVTLSTDNMGQNKKLKQKDLEKWGSDRKYVTTGGFRQVINLPFKMNYPESNAFERVLRFALIKGCYNPLTDVSYDDSQNPFEFILNKQSYSVIPRPEAATTLYTDYNIATNGTITGANINSFHWGLGAIGNRMDVVDVKIEEMRNNITHLNDRCDHLEAEIKQINSFMNFQNIMDVCCMGFGELGKLGSLFKAGGNAIAKICTGAADIEHAAVELTEEGVNTTEKILKTGTSGSVEIAEKEEALQLAIREGNAEKCVLQKDRLRIGAAGESGTVEIKTNLAKGEGGIAIGEDFEAGVTNVTDKEGKSVGKEFKIKGGKDPSVELNANTAEGKASLKIGENFEAGVANVTDKQGQSLGKEYKIKAGKPPDHTFEVSANSATGETSLQISDKFKARVTDIKDAEGGVIGKEAGIRIGTDPPLEMKANTNGSLSLGIGVVRGESNEVKEASFLAERTENGGYKAIIGKSADGSTLFEGSYGEKGFSFAIGRGADGAAKLAFDSTTGILEIGGHKISIEVVKKVISGGIQACYTLKGFVGKMKGQNAITSDIPADIDDPTEPNPNFHQAYEFSYNSDQDKVVYDLLADHVQIFGKLLDGWADEQWELWDEDQKKPSQLVDSRTLHAIFADFHAGFESKLQNHAEQMMTEERFKDLIGQFCEANPSLVNPFV
jgi:hypothetical protein